MIEIIGGMVIGLVASAFIFNHLLNKYTKLLDKILQLNNELIETVEEMIKRSDKK